MLQVRLLGQFDVRLNGVAVDLPSRPAQSLLAYLLLNAGTPHRREKLAGLLWPDASESNARSNLRHAVWRLRRALAAGGADFLLADNFTVAFDAAAPYWLDTAAVEQAAAADLPLNALREALSAYRGELLPGFYAEWVGLERERLHTVFERQMQVLLDRLCDAARWPDVLAEAERWLALGQAPERAYRALMLAHSGLGDVAGVAQVYQRCREALERDLGVEPSDQTRALYERLSRSGALPAGNGASRPVEIPAPRAAAPPAGLLGNLPAPTTKFVGREREVADLHRRLSNPACRLLTLIGPGGIGKTRLALQAAHQSAAEVRAAFPDGAYFVSLAPINAPELVISAVAEALRFTFYGGDDVRGQLLGYLRDRRALLVLDNFEHLLAATDLVTDLLRTAPGVKLVVTSQERLNLQGEWLFEVEGLPFPVGDAGPEPLAYGAVQLFLESARRVDAGFSLTPETLPAVLHICRLVGGVPLGVELAAAWVRTISPPEIAREIETNVNFLSTNQRDMPERHRSLAAVFDYAWQRMTERERTLYRQLSIFWGFRREVAEMVVGAALADLSALVDKSLLRRSSDGRYSMHGLLRKYAQLKLRESGEMPAVRGHHLDACLDLIRQAALGLRTGAQLDWLARLEAEHDNLRAAMKWSQECGRSDAGQEIAGGLAAFWYLRGYWQEGREWLGRMLALGPTGEALAAAPDGVKLARAAALMGAGWLADESGLEGPLYAESLALCQATGQRWGEAFSLRGVAVKASNDGEIDRSRDLLAQSLALFEQLGDPWGQGLVRYNLGWLTFSDNDYAASNELWTAALEHFQQSGDRWGQGVTFGGLSYLARLRDEYAQASSLSEQGLAVFREVGDKAGMAVSLIRLAQIAFRRGNYPQAIDLINESLGLVHDLDDKRGLLNSQSLLGLVYAYQGQYPEARALLQDSQALGHELWGADGTPYIVNYQATAAYMSGDLDEAHRLWETALLVLREQEDKLGTAASLHGLGIVAYRRGDFEKAQEWLDYSLALYRETKDRRYISIVLNALGRLALARGDRAQAAACLRESLVLRRELGDRQGLAETLETIAHLWTTSPNPQPDRTARLLGAAHHLRQIIGAPVPAVERADLAQLCATVRGGLRAGEGDAEFEAAWAAGERLAVSAPDKLVEMALDQAGLHA